MNYLLINYVKHIFILHFLSLLTDRLLYLIILINIDLSRWKKDETIFSVKLTDDKSGSMICRVPKPVLDLLKNPNSITFMVTRKKIVVNGGNKL